MKKTALIMAGGKGERFWPKSRKALPKQFLSLTGDGKTMIQLTVERILPLVDYDGIFIATNENYKHLVMEQLPQIPEENILCEPIGRNTAPCIGLGATYIQKKFGDAVMFVLPSDHLIKYVTMFRENLEDASNIAEQGENLVTIGITPTYPETGYGYIKINDKKFGRGYEVERFVEKPDLETAKTYIASESYLWNGGIFVWKASTILNNMKQHMSQTYEGLLRIKEAIGTTDEYEILNKEFEQFNSESIDYGVMEHAKNIYLVMSTFDWDDVGSWLAIERIQHSDEFENVIKGNVVSYDTKNTIIQGDKKLIATVGVENMIIVDTEDAILICEKNSAGNIKKITESLKTCNKTEFL